MVNLQLESESLSSEYLALKQCFKALDTKDNIYIYITFTSTHWRVQKCIHSSDTVFQAAGWISNLQGYIIYTHI